MGAAEDGWDPLRLPLPFFQSEDYFLGNCYLKKDFLHLIIAHSFGLSAKCALKKQCPESGRMGDVYYNLHKQPHLTSEEQICFSWHSSKSWTVDQCFPFR
ncbi:hypothetical protein CEXT_276081 [Caerostris extrusa]|uniref:Uncharacterized protein n=1 Tax=Caerostris extrusa TaxID=172846 RepID=A0AAV4WUQ5_CAEEX|nr:hypothetical protein CEXT_276081 [Caerostris extrusa]